MSPGRPWNRSWRQVEQWSLQLHLHARQSPSPIQPSFPPSSHQRSPRLAVVSSPYPCGSYFLCGQSVVRRFLSPPQPRRRPSPARPPPFTLTRAHPCLSVASQHGSGRSGLTPSLPQAHLETGQYKNSRCLEAAQYNSPVSMDLLRLKRSGGEKKKKCHLLMFVDICHAFAAGMNALAKTKRTHHIF